jgi:hypothetical protein
VVLRVKALLARVDLVAVGTELLVVVRPQAALIQVAAVAVNGTRTLAKQAAPA